MITNFPWREYVKLSRWFRMSEKERIADNDAVLPNLDVVPDSSGFYDRVGTNMDVVAYLHRVVVEVASVRLVGRAAQSLAMKS